MAGALFGVNEEFGVLLQLYALGNCETDQERQQYLKQFKELAGTVAIVTALGLAAAVFTAGTSYVAVRFGIKGLLLAFMRKASKYIDKLPLDSIV